LQTANRRSRNAAIRRKAIVDAALSEFLDKGFAAARMEDIARRARVAKGTIYLHFTDKEALFEAIVMQEIRPRVDEAAMGLAAGESLQEFVDHMLLSFVREVVNTRRGAVIRLLIGEAGRFPKLAEVYFRVVVEPGLTLITTLLKRASETGELRNDLLLEFPQLLMAPAILGVIWTGLFERFRHLDVEQMLHAYFQHMLAASDKPSKKDSAGKRQAKQIHRTQRKLK
jgi:AcrR family transcriptional regulator